MKRRTRIVYILSSLGGFEPPATVWIEKNAKGEVVYGVRCSARTLRKARERAEEEFRKLAQDHPGLMP